MKNKNIILLLTIFSGLIISGCNITNGYENAKIENVVKNEPRENRAFFFDRCSLQAP